MEESVSSTESGKEERDETLTDLNHDGPRLIPIHDVLDNLYTEV